jgi:hypothetical protein
MTGLALAGPLGPAPGVSNLVDVQCGELVFRFGCMATANVTAGN